MYETSMEYERYDKAPKLILIYNIRCIFGLKFKHSLYYEGKEASV